MNNEAVGRIAQIVSKYHIGCGLKKECNSECDKCCAQALIDAGYRLIPKELKGLCDEEIINILNEYLASGVENRIIFGQKISQATVEDIKKQIERYNKE